MAININNGGQTDFILSKAPSVAAIAGFGSGKTFATWMKIFNWMKEYPDVSHGYFAPTYSLIRDIFVPEVEEFCAEQKLACEFVSSRNLMYVQGFAPIFCRSMSDPSNIVGFQIGNAAVDEIDILPTAKAWQAWRKIKARCRKKLYEKGKKKKRKNQVKNQMALASTPEGFKFAYEAFKKKPIENSELYQMSTYTNAHNLPEDYITELMANYPPQLVDAYILGLFTNLTSGTIYTSFNRFLNHSNITPLKREVLRIGMDFNVQHMAGIIHVKRGENAIACGEVVDVLDTPAMIEALDELYPYNPKIIYPDATGKNRKSNNASTSDIKLLKEAGYRVIVDNSNPSVKDRILSMNAAFCNALGIRRYLVNTTQCPKYTQNLEQQAYNEQGLPDKDSDTDHTNDAGGYYIVKDFGISKPVSSSSRLIM